MKTALALIATMCAASLASTLASLDLATMAPSVVSPLKAKNKLKGGKKSRAASGLQGDVLVSAKTHNARLGEALGVSNGLPATAFSASSVYASSPGSYGPAFSRLNKNAGYGSNHPASCSAGQWIGVDLGSVRTIGGVATQGNANGYGNYFLRSYFIMYSMYGGGDWVFYSENGSRKLFNANYDFSTPVTNVIANPFQARFVRIVAQEFNGCPCFRFELYRAAQDQSGGQNLGLETRLPDDAFRASSCYGNDCNYYGPRNSRLHWTQNWGAWYPANNRAGEWVQVDLGRTQQVGAIATQGRSGNDYWVTEYTVQYSADGNSWQSVSKDGNEINFIGNTDGVNPNVNYLESPITARFVRLTVGAFQGVIALRWELYAPEVPSQRLGPSLGINNLVRTVADNQISWSSIRDNNSHYAHPRLQSRSGYMGWCPNTSNGVGEWVGVDLRNPTEIGGVATQGAGSNPNTVENYWVVYSLDGSQWSYLTKGGDRIVFRGMSSVSINSNTFNGPAVRHVFPVPILARYVRVVIAAPPTNGNWPCLRFDLYAPDSSRQGPSLDVLGKVFGLEDKTLPDGALSASSVYPTKNNVCAASFGRLRSTAGAGGWVAGEADTNQWFQIDTRDEAREIGGIATQGRSSKSDEFRGTTQFVVSYTISYTKDGSKWEFYTEDGEAKVFRGNQDTEAVWKNAFKTPFTAKAVRIHPQSWYGHPSLRAELYDTARYQNKLAADAEEAKKKALLEEEAKAKAAKEKLEAEERDRKARLEEERLEKIKLVEKARAAEREASKAETEKQKAEAAAAVAAAKEAIKKLEDAKVLEAARSKAREAELAAATKEAEEHERKIQKQIEEARSMRQRFVDAQKKLELLNDELVILRKRGVEDMKARAEKLTEIEETAAELTRQKRALVEAKRELKFFRNEQIARKKSLTKAIKEAQDRAYRAYLDAYNPFRRTGEDTWPFPRKRICTCKDTDDETMKALIIV